MATIEVKFPPQHKGVVRAQVHSSDNLSLVSQIEPEGYMLEKKGLQGTEAAVTIEEAG